MDFGWALRAMENGASVKREKWDELGAVSPREYASVALVVPSAGYERLFIVTTHGGERTMFNASHHQLLAKDWVLA